MLLEVLKELCNKKEMLFWMLDVLQFLLGNFKKITPLCKQFLMIFHDKFIILSNLDIKNDVITQEGFFLLFEVVWSAPHTIPLDQTL